VDLFVLTASTVDGVGVARGGALVDNGIQTSERSARVAGHAPESVGGARQQGCGGNGSGGPHDCGVVVIVLVGLFLYVGIAVQGPRVKASRRRI
jgi:hypothetical protein